MNPCDAEEEQPHTKKLKLSSSSPSGLSLLPDDMFLNCLARVPRSDYASLSLVSKWHRSVLFSPELYNFRSLLGCTENRIYICLLIPPDPNPRCFTLSPKSLNRRLVPVRSYLYQPPEASAIVAHGCGIYIMGGRIGGRASSSVLYLDCRSHTWTTLPSMGVARYSAVAGVVDGKIYVLGGCVDRKCRKSHRWGEVFDPKKQTWDALPTQRNRLGMPSLGREAMCESIVIEEEKKVVAMNGAGVCLSYTPSERKWKQGFRDMSGDNRCWHVIENVVYCSTKSGRILWCEPSELELEVMEWREVIGLEAYWRIFSNSKLVHYGGWLWDEWERRRSQEHVVTWGQRRLRIDEILSGLKLSNSGPNMLLFWDVCAPYKMEIRCAEISLERHKERREIRGKILWSEAVMTFGPPSHLQHCKILSTLPLNL